MPAVRTTDPAEAAALQAAGARLVRHCHDMVLDLAGVDPASDRTRPVLPAGLRLAGIEEARPRLSAAMLAAYEPGHPDSPGSPEEAERWVVGVLGGGPGPLLEPPSAAILDESTQLMVGALVVTRLEATAWGWDGGPWVAELLVVRACQGRGLGRTLLERAIAWSRAAAERQIGLTVTEGNSAERLYASAGFRRRRTLFILETA